MTGTPSRSERSCRFGARRTARASSSRLQATTSGQPRDRSCRVNGRLRSRCPASTTWMIVWLSPPTATRRATRSSSVTDSIPYIPGVSRTSTCRLAHRDPATRHLDRRPRIVGDDRVDPGQPTEQRTLPDVRSTHQHQPSSDRCLPAPSPGGLLWPRDSRLSTTLNWSIPRAAGSEREAAPGRRESRGQNAPFDRGELTAVSRGAAERSSRSTKPQNRSGRDVGREVLVGHDAEDAGDGGHAEERCRSGRRADRPARAGWRMEA